MFKHLPVPIDLSARNTRTLTITLELAARNRASITLLHVIHCVANVLLRELRGFYRQLSVKSERKLEIAAAPFIRKGVRVRPAVAIGLPAPEIIKLAARTQVDLIVMGSHNVDPTRPGQCCGASSYEVGIGYQCPVMPKAEPHDRGSSGAASL
jgi:nucleotide-binding universal stress UspA family protein